MVHKPQEIRRFVLQQVFLCTASPVADTAYRFKISREAVYRHVRQMIAEGLLETEGEGRSRTYRLVSNMKAPTTYKLASKLEEYLVWHDAAKPMLKDLPPADQEICQYGFTEMVNNVIDHSAGENLMVQIERTPVSVTMRVCDDGVGIFKKIAREFNLADEREAILELSKGKLTTDPKRHTGEGIFFTSRVFDRFSISSGKLFFRHSKPSDAWLIEDDEDSNPGTMVTMDLLIPAKRTLQQAFAKFTTGPDDYSFSRTHVPLSLAQYGDENLVSRSQAKRVLTRFERFQEVMLDFAGVKTIGQSFADEIFRVFALAHPEIHVLHTNANKQVEGMIKRALSAKAEYSEINDEQS